MHTNDILVQETTFDHFLKNKDYQYLSDLKNIKLFQSSQPIMLTAAQKQTFAAVFYHLRGHFINFMWYISNFSTDSKVKDIILSNIKEELGSKNNLSHEMLYSKFAAECGVNIKEEMVFETHYLPFAKQFNQGHLHWLTTHDAEEAMAAFAAYERLDNIDYPVLFELVKTFGLANQSMTFFTVHIHVKHFDETLDFLQPLWDRHPDKVKKAFAFIYAHQLNMWRQLSDVLQLETNT